MRLPERNSRVACGVGLAVASLALIVSLRGTAVRTPFVPNTLPQRALGDFDGDGRVDTAVIQDDFGNRQIAVKLSGSVSSVRLEAPITAVVQDDVDHDGDLDLVAATADGDILIWLNDGRGHFVQQPRRTGQDLAGVPVVVQVTRLDVAFVSDRSPILPSMERQETTLFVRQARAPAVCVVYDVRCSLLPSPRAPPVAL
jgi:hypothetical protein